MTRPDPTRSTVRRLVATAVLLVFVVAACGAASPPATVAPVPDATATDAPTSAGPGTAEPAAPVPPLSDADVLAAMRSREQLGLRADDAWVRQVAADPNAVLDWGFPLLPFEAAELADRPTGDDVVTTAVRSYLESHPDISGGLYLDQARGGVITALVTADPEVHEAAIRALVDGPAPIAVRQVRWTEAELLHLQERISDAQAFLTSLPARMTTSSVNVIDNRVDLSISSAVPDAADRIATQVGAQPGQLVVTSDGTGLLLQPTGRIVGHITAPAGTDMSALSPQYEADVDIGAQDAVGIAVGPDGTFTIDDLPPTGYTVTILELADAGNREVGSARAIVPPGGVVAIEIPINP